MTLTDQPAASCRSLLVVLVYDLSVDDVLTARGAARRGARAPTGTGTRRRSFIGVVEQRPGLLRGLGELLVPGADAVDVRPAQRTPQVRQRLADLVPSRLRQLVAALGEELLGLPLQRLGQVADLGVLLALA